MSNLLRELHELRGSQYSPKRHHRPTLSTIIKSLRSGRPWSTVEEFVATRHNPDDVLPQLENFETQIMKFSSHGLADCRHIRVELKDGASYHDNKSWALCSPETPVDETIPESDKVNIQSYFAPLKLIVEAGVKPVEAVKPENQKLITVYLKKRSVSKVMVHWLTNIDLVIPSLASELVQAQYNNYASTSDKGLKKLRLQKLVSCGVKELDFKVYLPSMDIFTVFVVIQAMLQLSNESENDRQEWEKAAQKMVHAYPSKTLIETTFTNLKQI
ncbi:hypothetical protein CIB48_g9382 [Xylaria polymorpha]|nr:hypothetical protein CIB48_g9382 [Xylaria polymorpha]